MAFLRASLAPALCAHRLCAVVASPDKLASAAHAVEAVNVRSRRRRDRSDRAVEFQHTDGDRVQVSTAPGADGIVRRIEVRAREAGQTGRCSRSPTTATSRSTA